MKLKNLQKRYKKTKKFKNEKTAFKQFIISKDEMNKFQREKETKKNCEKQLF